MDNPATQNPPPGDPTISAVEARRSFVRACHFCDKPGKWTPETLYRSCITDDLETYASEPAKHLTRVETLDRNGYDPDLEKRVQVLFASTCPNPACQKPAFLRVEGKKIEFVKIIRQRQGKPHGQTEEDLRLLELELVATVPKMPLEPEGLKWICSLELGPLCETLNRLAPEAVEKRDAVDVAATCQSLLDELLFKLEARKEIRSQVEWLQKRDRWGVFGFILDLDNAMSGRKIFKPIAKAYKSAKAQDPSKFDGQTLVDTLSYAQFDGAEVRRSLEKALKTQHKNRKASERPSAVARIYALYEHALVDRAVWRWAVRMDQESKASGEEFFSHKRKAELAAFVRVLADDAFEQSDEILVTFNERKERRQKEGGRVPTK